MARVGFTPAALAQLDSMIATHELPADTVQRVAKSVAHLASFPDSGSRLAGEWDGFRFVLGPWSWMLCIYVRLDEEQVAITTIEDSRTARAASSIRP